MRKSPFRSSAGIAACYILLLIVTQYFYEYQKDLVLGLAVLAVLVMFHNILIHRRIASATNSEELGLTLDDEEGLDDGSDVGPPARENNPL